MSNKTLMSLIDKTDELMSRCRWIGCRLEGTNTVGVPCAATGRRNYQERVMNVWNRRRQREINNARGPNDGQQVEIIFESRRKNVPDTKAGDTDDNKTVKASNTWEENAMYAGRDGHYEEMEYYGPQEHYEPWEEDELDNWNTEEWGNCDIFAEDNEE